MAILISELLGAFGKLIYWALLELSHMAPSDSDLCGSLISELLGAFSSSFPRESAHSFMAVYGELKQTTCLPKVSRLIYK